MRGRNVARMLAALAVSGAALLSTVGPAAAERGTADAGAEPQVQRAESVGVQLSDTQAKKLKTAWKADRSLSADDVRGLLDVGADGGVSTRDSGSGTSLGDCSEVTLWGDDDGNFTVKNEVFWRSKGEFLFGHFTTTTNGIFATSDDYYPSGKSQVYDGQLFSAGTFGTQTEWDGWAYTSQDYLCFGVVHAVWE